MTVPTEPPVGRFPGEKDEHARYFHARQAFPLQRNSSEIVDPELTVYFHVLYVEMNVAHGEPGLVWRRQLRFCRRQMGRDESENQEQSHTGKVYSRSSGNKQPIICVWLERRKLATTRHYRPSTAFWEAARIALDSLRKNKLRSFLTLLGIILATTTLISVTALIHGMNLYIAEKVSNMGADGFRIVRMAWFGPWDPQEIPRDAEEEPGNQAGGIRVHQGQDPARERESEW